MISLKYVLETLEKALKIYDFNSVIKLKKKAGMEKTRDI